jgi:hypothetical protein
MKIKFLLVFVLIIFSLMSCEYFEEGTTLNVNTFEANIDGLPAIPDSMTYVGWFERFDQDKGVEYFVKVFFQDANSNGVINYKSEQSLKSLQEAQQFWLTTEKKTSVNDSTLKPSSRIILKGNFLEAASSLFISNEQSAFDTSKTVFNLITPTDGLSTNELSGIWFVDSVSTKPVPVAGLELPVLYSGWIYEGWVQVGSKYISTGRFSNPAAADKYSGYSGPQTGYNFPGEDFLQNAPSGVTFPLDLSNAKVAISLEYNDGKTHSDQPYLKIFEGTVPASAQSGVSYAMQFTNPVLAGGNSFMIIDLVK